MPLRCFLVLLLLGLFDLTAQGDAPPKPPVNDQTQAWIDGYFRHNGAPLGSTVRVGQRVEELVKLLGEPTTRYQSPKPGKPAENWIGWYRNPRGLHVAPYLRARVVDGIVVEIRSGRG